MHTYCLVVEYEWPVILFMQSTRKPVRRSCDRRRIFLTGGVGPP